jgi:hypothetical protein
VPRFRGAVPRAVLRPVRSEDRTTLLAWVQELEPQGFLLIAPDEGLQPILGFSFTASFDTTESPENHLLLLIRQEMPLRLRALAENAVGAEYRQQAGRQWRYLTAPSPSLQAMPAPLAWAVETGPLLASRWNQADDNEGNPVFNYYTPNQWVCGCVATAMSQILYYHRWPDSGTGSHSYTWEGETLSADFSAASYAWDQMVDDYNSPGDEPLANRQAVGLLTWHTGVGVDMDYAADGSGALAMEVPPALENYFRHHGLWIERSAADFFDRLYANMLTGRPALLAIATSTLVGHAVVVDGVRHESGGTKYYHLNLGWSGAYDAWYDLSGPWSTGGYTWSTIAGAVIDILPVQNLADPGESLSGGSVSLSWSEGTQFAPASYEIQQARIDPAVTALSDGAESGTANWLTGGQWKQTSVARRTGSYSFKGYISEESTVKRSFSSFELNRAVRIGGTSQITYYWAAYYFHNTAARLEISADEHNWTPLRTHTSTATSWPVSWNSNTLSPSDLSAWIGQTVSLRFVIDLTGTSWYVGAAVGFYFDDFRIQECALGSWSVVDNAVIGHSKTVTLAQSGTYAWRVRGYWNSQWWPWSDVEGADVEVPELLTLQLRALLQGPYAGSGVMRSDLLPAGVIPLSSPYPEAPAAAASIPDEAVDWVLVQFYEEDGSTLAASRSGFLRRDGQLLDQAGSPGLTLSTLFRSRSYYILLRHRNHVAVMSAAPLSFAAGSASYDFTAGIDRYYGSGGASQLESGIWGLWAGDADQDGAVDAGDFALWQTAARSGSAGYQDADLRLDSRVTTADYVTWYENARAGAACAFTLPLTP